jgi:beta-lactamase regulating signal transducer with metallopeptidase domain
MMLAMLHTWLLAGLLCVLTWVVARTRFVQRRPAVACWLWFVVLLKCALPWGPKLTWLSYEAASSTPPMTAGATLKVARAWDWSSSLWLGLGLGLLVISFTITSVRFFRRWHRSQVLWMQARGAAPIGRQQYAALAELMAPNTTVRIVVSQVATTPYCVGLLSPNIVLPVALSATQMRAAVAHEYAHIARGDLWQRLMQVLICDLLWFLPIVRFASRRLDIAREAACDAHAIAATQMSMSQYAGTLLSFATADGRRIESLAMSAGPLRDRFIWLGQSVRASTSTFGKIGLVGWMLMAMVGVQRKSIAAPRPCLYSQSVATALMERHPEADLNSDGMLSRQEVCEFEFTSEPMTVTDDSTVNSSVTIALSPRKLQASMCCNCGSGSGTPLPSIMNNGPAFAGSVSEPEECVQGVE